MRFRVAKNQRRVTVACALTCAAMVVAVGLGAYLFQSWDRGQSPQNLPFPVLRVASAVVTGGWRIGILSTYTGPPYSPSDLMYSGNIEYRVRNLTSGTCLVRGAILDAKHGSGEVSYWPRASNQTSLETGDYFLIQNGRISPVFSFELWCDRGELWAIKVTGHSLMNSTEVATGWEVTVVRTHPAGMGAFSYSENLTYRVYDDPYTLTADHPVTHGMVLDAAHGSGDVSYWPAGPSQSTVDVGDYFIIKKGLVSPPFAFEIVSGTGAYMVISVWGSSDQSPSEPNQPSLPPSASPSVGLWIAVASGATLVAGVAVAVAMRTGWVGRRTRPRDPRP